MHALLKKTKLILNKFQNVASCNTFLTRKFISAKLFNRKTKLIINTLKKIMTITKVLM